MLAGEGAVSFARKHSIQCLQPEALICPRSRRDWGLWKARLGSNQKSAQSWDTDDLRKVQDTVGAVTWDSAGHLASGVSR